MSVRCAVWNAIEPVVADTVANDIDPAFEDTLRPAIAATFLDTSNGWVVESQAVSDGAHQRIQNTGYRARSLIAGSVVM